MRVEIRFNEKQEIVVETNDIYIPRFHKSDLQSAAIFIQTVASSM